MTLFLLFTGLLVLIVGAELLVRGASQLAAFFKISPLIVGLTIVAFGTSSPEMVVSVKAALSGHPDLVMGTNLGSTIFNILLILGLCAIVAPLTVSQQLVWYEVPIMIGAHLLLAFLVFIGEGTINGWGGFLLFSGILVYTFLAIYKGKQESAEVRSEYETAFSFKKQRWSTLTIAKQLGLIAAGLGLCVLGAGWLLESAVDLARALGVSELVIGITIIAAGTSFPELATSIIATIRGQRDIAVGNVVGSNIFNILANIGVAALVAPKGIAVAPAVMRLDLPVAIAACAACLPIFFTGHKISRGEGLLLICYYILYTSYLLLSARNHEWLPLFQTLMLYFVVPLTVIALIVELYRQSRSQPQD